MMPRSQSGRGLGTGVARDEAIVAASRDRQRQSPCDWGVQEVQTITLTGLHMAICAGCGFEEGV